MRLARSVFFVSLFLVIQSASAVSFDLVVGPYLQNIKRDAVTVMWETATASVGKVIYGADVLADSAVDIRNATMHEVTLTGLTPGTRYTYRCAWGSQLAPPAQFKTAPSEGTRQCRIVLYGDSRSDTETHSKIAALIAREEPDIVINTGDLVSDGSQYDQWKPQLFEPILPFASSIPWFTVPGNHEHESVHYYNYMSLPGNESWWSTDYANVHIVGLDSCLASDEDSEQYRWLLQDLQDNRQEWTLACFHHPLFTAHPTRSAPPYRWAWQSLFQEYGVDLAVSGHDHYYHRTYQIGSVDLEPKRDVVHITTGGGGASLYPTVEQSYSAYRRSCYHFVVLDVGGDRIVGRVIDIEGKGIDAFVLDKQSVPSPEEFVSYEALALESKLLEAVNEILPVAVEGKECLVDRDLRTETGFKVPVVVSGRWEGRQQWSIEPAEFRFSLLPDSPLAIPMTARVQKANVYPLPTLHLAVTADQSGFRYTDPQIGFRNKTIQARPLKVFTSEESKPRKIKHKPIIDGHLDEKDWERAFIVDSFLTDEGTAFLAKKTEIILMTDKKNLFVGARVQQNPF
ncbi:MAG: metallophosphoesterase, partial [bacterium]